MGHRSAWAGSAWQQNHPAGSEFQIHPSPLPCRTALLRIAFGARETGDKYLSVFSLVARARPVTRHAEAGARACGAGEVAQ